VGHELAAHAVALGAEFGQRFEQLGLAGAAGLADRTGGALDQPVVEQA
jgi:hypothetical protein